MFSRRKRLSQMWNVLKCYFDDRKAVLQFRHWPTDGMNSRNQVPVCLTSAIHLPLLEQRRNENDVIIHTTVYLRAIRKKISIKTYCVAVFFSNDKKSKLFLQVEAQSDYWPSAWRHRCEWTGLSPRHESWHRQLDCRQCEYRSELEIRNDRRIQHRGGRL